MLEIIKTYKNFFHVLLSVIILWFYDNIIIINDNLGYIPVVISSVVTAYIIEKTQEQLKLGTATAWGGLKSSTAAIIYLILNIIN